MMGLKIDELTEGVYITDGYTKLLRVQRIKTFSKPSIRKEVVVENAIGETCGFCLGAGHQHRSGKACVNCAGTGQVNETESMTEHTLRKFQVVSCPQVVGVAA